jgi:RNA polymerase sigma factor (sigma-70 family)
MRFSAHGRRGKAALERLPMAKNSTGQLSRCLRDIVDSHCNDRELLGRFLDHHDEQAFETLVRRHDRLVRSAIGKVLGNTPAAEDAYQAVFLVLVRRSRTVDWRTGLGPWLYGVAHRVAVKARARSARLARLESAARPGQPILPADLSWVEACDLLHAELDRLPDRYRVPLLLCYLEGKTREEAAAALGITSGTVKGRIRRGCDLLRDRLARRGVALSVGLLAALAAPSVTASTLTSPTAVVAALRGTARTRATELAQEVIMGSILSKLASIAAVGVLSTAVVAVLVAAAGLAAQTQPPDTPAGQKAGNTSVQTEVPGGPLPAGARVRLGTLKWRHGVTSVAFTPDGKAILTGGTDDSIRLWDRQTGKEIRRFQGPPGPSDMNGPSGPIWVALSGNGKYLAANYWNRGIMIWELESGNELRRMPGGAFGAGMLQLTSDGKTLVFRGWNQWALVLETLTGKELQVIKGQQQMAGPIGFNPASAGMAVSPDGKTLASAVVEAPLGGLSGYFVNLIDLESGKVTRQIEESDAVSAVAYSPNGKVLAYGTGLAILLRDAKTAKEIRKIKAPNHVTALAFSPDNKLVAAKAGDLLIRIWDAGTGQEIHKLGEGINNAGFMQPSLMQSFAFSPDSKFLVASAGSSLRMWDVGTGKEVPLSGGHQGPVTGFVVAPDGKTVVSRGGDKALRWDAVTGKELGGFRLPLGTYSVAFTADSRTAALSIGERIHVVDAVTGKELRQLPGPGGKCAVALAFSPNGKVLASRGWSEIQLFDALHGTLLKQIALPAYQLPDPRAGIAGDNVTTMTLAFSPDGQTLAGPVRDTLRFWDVTTAKEIGKSALPQAVTGMMAYSPDGRVLALENTDQTISLWETATGKERGRIGHKAAADSTAEPPFRQGLILAFSPDGGLLATRAGHDVVVWEVVAGKEVGRFKGHEEDITALAFFPDGKSLVSGSADTTSLVWDAGKLKREASAPAAVLQPKEVDALWADLAGDDAAKAFRSILTLASAKQTVPYLRERMQPVPPVDPKIIQQLIADLDSDNFQTRTKASKELEKLGEAAVPALREVLAGKTSLETQQRVQPILAKLTSGVLTVEQVRLVRAVEVLERLATPEARQLLQSLAEGAPGALPTEQARAALGRLAR